MGPPRSRAGGRKSAGLYAVRTGGVATPRRSAVPGSHSRSGSSTCGRVVAFTERHNLRSRAVMERIDMSYAGEFLGTGLIEGRHGVHDGAPFALYVALRDT